MRGRRAATKSTLPRAARGGVRCAVRVGALACAGLVGLVPVRTAAAEAVASEPVRLVWLRSPGADACLDDVALAERVSARLGRSAFSERAARRVEGLVQREDGRWVAHLYARDATGKVTGARDLSSEAADCTGLDAAVTLAVALVIDPDAALRAEPSPPPVPPQPPLDPPHAPLATPPPLAPPPVARCDAPPQAPSPSPPAAQPTVVTGRAAITQGLLPQAAPAFALAVDIPLFRGLHASTGVLFLPERRTASGEFGFGLTAPWVGVCGAAWRSSRLGVEVCEDLLMGSIYAVDYELLPVEPGDRLWLATQSEAELRARLVGPLTATIGVALVLPVTRQAFTVEGLGTIFQQPVGDVMGFAGLGVAIP